MENPNRIAEATDPHTIAGDWLDDDPQVIDDLVQPDPDPPTADELPRDSDDIPAVARVVGTRVISRSYYEIRPLEPVFVLPADPNRTTLVITNSGSFDMMFADSRAGVSSGYLGHIVRSWSELTLTGYTGAVWIAPVDLGQPDYTGNTKMSASVSGITS